MATNATMPAMTFVFVLSDAMGQRLFTSDAVGGQVKRRQTELTK
jgi:hypothetical protein